MLITRRHLARLLRCLLRRPVCRPAAGAGVDARRASAARTAYIDQLRRQIVGVRRGRRPSASTSSRGSWPRPPRNSRRSACTAAMVGDRGAAGEAGRPAAARRRPSSATSSSPRAARAIRTACRSRQDALMANLAGIAGPAGLDVVAGRPRRELAAALSRHGPDRLPAGAAVAPSSRSTI